MTNLVKVLLVKLNIYAGNHKAYFDQDCWGGSIVKEAKITARHGPAIPWMAQQETGCIGNGTGYLPCQCLGSLVVGAVQHLHADWPVFYCACGCAVEVYGYVQIPLPAVVEPYYCVYIVCLGAGCILVEGRDVDACGG